MKMKSLIFVISLLSISLFGQNLKPYTIGLEMSGSVSDVHSKVKTVLQDNGFDILGSYKPGQDDNRIMIAITSSKLLNAIKSKGDLTGFAGALRIGITNENDQITVSFTTPEYWLSAYFQKDYSSIESIAKELHLNIQNALSGLGNFIDSGFGSSKGLSSGDLQSYHYMFGMPYFEDNIKLATHADFGTATSNIESNLKTSSDAILVYSIKVPGKNIKLYGIELKGGDGESSFLPIIDTGSPKHTAFLPYEILVVDGNIFMMHGRFRIALSFPDLSMGTFMKIVSTPGNIKDAMEKIAQ